MKEVMFLNPWVNKAILAPWDIEMSKYHNCVGVQDSLWSSL